MSAGHTNPIEKTMLGDVKGSSLHLEDIVEKRIEEDTVK